MTWYYSARREEGYQGTKTKCMVIRSIASILAYSPKQKKSDVHFLRMEERKFLEFLQASTAAEKVSSPQGTTAASNSRIVFTWLADLRVVHVLIDDEVRAAFLKRHEPMDRQQLDGRNSPHRPKTWFELAAALYNSLTFSPISMILPNSHDDFNKSYNLAFANMPGPCTPDQINTWFTDRRTKLMKMMAKYERSGNGHGNQLEPDTSANEDDIQHKDDDQKDYLGEYRSSLLYFWELAERYEIIKSTVAELNRNQTATTENIPVASEPTEAHKEKKRKAKDKSEDNLAKIGKGLESIATSSTMDSLSKVLRNCESAIVEILQKMESLTPGTMIYEFYESRLEENKQMLKKAQTSMNAML